MAANPSDSYASDDFLEQILSIPSYGGLAGADGANASEASLLNNTVSQLAPSAAGGLQNTPAMFPLSLSLDNGRDTMNDRGTFSVKPESEGVNVSMGSLYPGFDQLQSHTFQAPQVPQPFQALPTAGTGVNASHPHVTRPRVRARRGQATDPHSIAERLRRERISERIKALQELVPSCNKTDRAAMLDEILDYVKFLRLQVKVLSMSRLGGAGAVAQLVADIPFQPIEDGGNQQQQAWEKWSNEDTECEVAKLMEEDVGSAMQLLQSKSLCIMPISLAALIYPAEQSSDLVKPEPSATL